MAKLFIHYYVGIPISFLYSLILSFLVLYYFLNKEKTNILLFIIGVIHLGALFLLPMLCFVLVLLPTGDTILEFNEPFYQLTIDIISYANHILNKLIYPIVVAYSSSGYISIYKKLLYRSLKDWIFDFLDSWIGLIGAIIIAICSEAEYILDYLNILDLITVYIEIGYSIASLIALYNKKFNKVGEYKYFMLGKLLHHEEEEIKEFKDDFKELCKLYRNNIEKIDKFSNFSEIQIFIDKVNSQKYFQENEIEIRESEKEKGNMTEKELESKLSNPYKECKSHYKLLERIKNIRKDILSVTDQNEICCGYCKCCCSPCCKKFYFGFYAFLCFLIIGTEIFSYNSPMFNEENFRNTSLTYEPGNITFTYSEIPYWLLGHPLIYFGVSITSGIYILPLLYALINRQKITGDFIYAKKSSDTIDFANSLGTITEKLIPTVYLSSIFYGMIYYACYDNYKFDVNTLYFFQIPQSKYVLYFKYSFLVIFILVMRYFDNIDLKCHKININDECYFDKKCELSCIYEQKRNEFIEKGIGPRIINYQNYPTQQTY